MARDAWSRHSMRRPPGTLPRILRKRGVAAVAVCFMNAFMNGANERRMKAILEDELPGIPITASADVLPEIFEHERFSTTVVNAVLTPVVGAYTARLGERLAEGGYRRHWPRPAPGRTGSGRSA